MTKDELAKEFNVTLTERDIVKGPGKFEGEHWSTLYFYDAFLNGDFGESEFEDTGEVIYYLDDNEKKLFNTTLGAFVLRNHDNGFVTGSFCHKSEAERAINNYQNEQADLDL